VKIVSSIYNLQNIMVLAITYSRLATQYLMALGSLRHGGNKDKELAIRKK